MVQTFDKKTLALHQLDTAIQIYETGGDRFAVITLAGAAEEILGKLITLRGGTHALDDLVQATRAIHRFTTGQPLDEKIVRERANAARNASKHLDDQDELTVTLDLEQEALDLLDRAITNYWRLESALSPAMMRFERSPRAT